MTLGEAQKLVFVVGEERVTQLIFFLPGVRYNI